MATVVSVLDSIDPTLKINPDLSLDINDLVRWVTGLTRHQQLANRQYALSPEQVQTLKTAIRQRLAGTPVPLITGHLFFLGHSFSVKSGVLMPRPETERLVEIAHELIQKNSTLTVVELGSGAGVIGISLALACPTCTVSAWDINPEAVKLTLANKQRLSAHNFSVHWGDFFDTVQPTDLPVQHLIVSNPPYIRSADIPSLDPSVRTHDPVTALDGGCDGLSYYKRLMEQFPTSRMVLEIGFDQGPSVHALAVKNKFTCTVVKDYAGHDRIVILTPKISTAGWPS